MALRWSAGLGTHCSSIDISLLWSEDNFWGFGYSIFYKHAARWGYDDTFIVDFRII